MRTFDVVKKLQDLTALTWDERAVTSGTGGTFLKARARTSRADIYYKLSCYDRYRGIYGHESVNELVASRLLTQLGIPHIPYKLVHAAVAVDGVRHETWLSESHDYRRAGERRQPLDTFCDLNAETGQSPLDFCIDRGWNKEVFEMMAFDYLIMNRDRHGANIEVLYRNGGIEFAPLFDHGLSLVCFCYDDESRVLAFDSLGDVRAQNYLGSHSLEDNLRFVPRGLFHADQLSDPICRSLFHGLEAVVSATHIEKMREIITLRWMHLAELGIVEEA